MAIWLSRGIHQPPGDITFGAWALSVPPSLLGPLFLGEGKWKALLLGGGKAQAGSNAPGATLQRGAGLGSAPARLTLHWALQLRGLAGGLVPGARLIPLPIPTAQGAPGGPGHLLPILFEPSAAAVKAPPLPRPTLKELDLKLI